MLNAIAEEVPEVLGVSWGFRSQSLFHLHRASEFLLPEQWLPMAFQRAVGLPYEESMRRAYSVALKLRDLRSTGLGDVTALDAGCRAEVEVGSPYHGPDLRNGPGRARVGV